MCRVANRNETIDQIGASASFEWVIFDTPEREVNDANEFKQSQI